MKANTAARFRLYPTGAQAKRLMSWSHTCRAVWNTALAQRIWAYQSARRITLRTVDQCVELTQARTEHEWLRDLPAQCAQQVLRHLATASAGTSRSVCIGRSRSSHRSTPGRQSG